ncbi:MAG: alkaline shock response membrane anchor protein AmaP [Candidatus Omnitrophota bacterium]
MKIFNLMIVLFILFSAILGTIILCFSLHLFELNDILFNLNEFYYNLNSRITLAAIGVIFILISLLFAQIGSARHEREKTIAFNNPSGQVTITLFAVEDLIRKIGQELPQVKEIRPNVVATKKRGLLIRIRLILKSESNIPEFTSQLQEMVKSRIQEIFGIDEQIIVKIHVAKILTRPEKVKRNISAEEHSEHQEQNFHTPYQRV